MKRKKVLIILVLIISITLSLSEYVHVKNYYNSIENNKNEIIQKNINYYNTIIYMYRTLARICFEEAINNNQEVLDIIDKANNVDEEERAVLRERLIYILNPTYNNAVETDFRQFQFLLVDCTSFLRMHAQNIYGENLKEVRDTFRIAIEEQKYVEGFEEDIIYNGYRFVFPLFNENRLIGAAETSISYGGVIKSLDNLFGTKGLFIIKKETIYEKVLDENLDNYVQCKVLEDYYCDREIYEYLYYDGDNIDLLDEINETVKEDVAILEKTSNNFVVNTKIDGDYYSVVYLAIENINEEKNAYLVFYEKNPALINYENKLLTNSLIIIFLWIVVLAVYFLLSWTNKKVEILIGTDNLTKTYNRTKFYEIIGMELKRKERFDNNISLIMYDIDYFKRINDKYGHNKGDSVLKEITQLIKVNIRQIDYLFRWGGEEFIIVLPHTKLLDAVEAAEKLRKKIEKFNFQLDGLEKVTVSFGVVEFNTNESIDDLINRVDELLYEAKRSGRNQVKY